MITPKIQTYTGLMVDPLNMRPDDINAEDIAHALSNICRFTGHCARFYSVAEHSINVARLIEHWGGNPDYGYLHDASEAYLCDIARPLKQLPQFDWYRESEKRVQRTIYERFGLDPEEPEYLKRADVAVLGLEARLLMRTRGHKEWDWCLREIPFDFRLDPYVWQSIEMRFLPMLSGVLAKATSQDQAN